MDKGSKPFKVTQKTYLNPTSRKQVLCHGFDEHFKEEPGVVHELANDQLVSLCRSEDGFQIAGQLIVNCSVFGAGNRLSHKHILKYTQ